MAQDLLVRSTGTDQRLGWEVLRVREVPVAPGPGWPGYRDVTIAVTVHVPLDTRDSDVAEALGKALDEPPCYWDDWVVGPARLLSGHGPAAGEPVVFSADTATGRIAAETGDWADDDPRWAAVTMAGPAGTLMVATEVEPWAEDEHTMDRATAAVAGLGYTVSGWKQRPDRNGELRFAVVTGYVPTVSVNDVLSGQLPAAATGVRWTDTRWTDCRAHLADPGWTPERSDTKTGIVLTGSVPCDACAESRAAAPTLAQLVRWLEDDAHGSCASDLAAAPPELQPAAARAAAACCEHPRYDDDAARNLPAQLRAWAAAHDNPATR